MVRSQALVAVTRSFSLCLAAVFVFLPACAASLFSQSSPERVGISGSPLQLALRDALLMALDANTEIRVQRTNVDAERFTLMNRRGAFDPHLRFSFDLLSETLPVGSILAGGGRGSLDNDAVRGTFSFNQDLPFAGSVSGAFDSRRTTTSNVFTQLNPQFPSSWNLSLTFPLWRDLGIDRRRREVRVAALTLERSEADLRRTLLDIVTAVRVGYWDLVFAREDAAVRREAVQLAREQVERNRRLVAAGQAPAVDVIEAEAALQSRQEDFLASIERITLRENSLKQLILGSRSADAWAREILPVDATEAGQVDAEPEAAWLTASELRPELASMRKRQEAQRIDTEYFRNQTQPRLDVVATYGSTGLAGIARSGENPFSSQNTLIAGRLNELSSLAGLPPIAVAPSAQLPERLLGGYGRSLNNLFGNDFRTGEIALRLELPLGNRAAHGDLGRSLAAERQLQATRSALEQQIEAEIRNALQAVRTARQRVDAAAAALAASREKLESERRLFQAGETTNFLVLTRETDYTANRGREVRARMDLNIATARLQRTLGNALETFDIRFEGR